MCIRDKGSGIACLKLELPRELFFQTLSTETGIEVRDDGDLFQQLTALASVKREYDKVADALESVKNTGYGIVVPTIEELK